MNNGNANHAHVHLNGKNSPVCDEETNEQMLALATLVGDSKIDTMHMRFVAAARQIDVLLQHRVEALTAMGLLDAIRQKEIRDGVELKSRSFSGTTVTFAVGDSDSPTQVDIALGINDFGMIENALVICTMKIVPVFFKFENGDRILLPFSDSTGIPMERWIEDRVSEFSKAFLNIQLQDQPRKTSAINNGLLPKSSKAHSFGRTGQAGDASHFFTKESFFQFQDAPLKLQTHFTGKAPHANGIV